MADAASQSRVDVERSRQRLRELEQELTRTVDHDIEGARASADNQVDSVDQTVAGEVRDEYFDLAQADTDVLTQVREALARIDAGTFGRCVVDGEPIEPTRLEAAPWTRYCAWHQNEAETAARLRTPRA
jgi:RNA polymerase-binding transcription factor DksA